ncbi:MAG: N-formylglutamate amidohydrolase [bacterium]
MHFRLESTCKTSNWEVEHNQPFEGSYVPLRYFHREKRVKSIMIEINRGNYMDESNGLRSPDFDSTVKLIQEFLQHISTRL